MPSAFDMSFSSWPKKVETTFSYSVLGKLSLFERQTWEKLFAKSAEDQRGQRGCNGAELNAFIAVLCQVIWVWCSIDVIVKMQRKSRNFRVFTKIID